MSAVAGRRTYTEDELQAALRDIQSGKLGTRRAAVIYGIPRSTLRNKVYKLALERERESHLNTSTPLKIDEEEVDDEKELSGAEEEKEVEKALQQPLLSMADILRFSNLENTDAVKQLIQKNSRDGGGQEWNNSVEPHVIAPYIQNLLLNSGSIVPGVKPNESELNTMLPEFVKRMMAEEQLFKDQMKLNNGDVTIPRPSPSNSVASQKDKSKSESDMETEESPSNVILKIPSFKPTTSKNGCDIYKPSVDASLVSPPVTSDSSSPPILPGKSMSLKDVKEVIAKSISQKFQQSPEPAARLAVDMDFKRSGFTPPLGAISVIKPQTEVNRQFQSAPQQKNQQNSNQPNQGGKGTRPKRGKYRNYDRDSLVEAVRAVQRGEMSVHRAGSYYGVPHSTLEYKVKERHLMRPRKRDPKPNPVDEKIASLKQSDMRNNAEKMKPALKQPQKFPPTSPNGMKMPMFEPSPLGYSPAPFPFWPHPGFPQFPLEYGRTSTAFATNPEFFATQMMQKMQEERTHSNATPTTPNSALPKSARQIAESLLEGPGANGSFLDGIIRSSLESGVPISEDKSPKEEKNVAPENMSNKALLDQLCRNSRLTPLPKPNLVETNSSGDESYRKSSSPINFTTTNSKDVSVSSIGGDVTPPPPSLTQHDIHTIELSNDSNDESTTTTTKKEEIKVSTTVAPGRIYLKQELTKPENLKPEMLVRYRDVLHDVDRNGVVETAAGSASESDAVQD